MSRSQLRTVHARGHVKQLTSCIDTDKLITAAFMSYFKRKDCVSESGSAPLKSACANSQEDEINPAYDSVSAGKQMEPGDTSDDENIEII